MPTIKEVAKRAGVSVGTASHVLNGKVPVSERLRQKVEKAMAALDYHPSHIARSLSTQHTHTLGMVIPDITNPFFPQVIRGAESVATQSGFSLILLTVTTSLIAKRKLFLFSGQGASMEFCSSLPRGVTTVRISRQPSKLVSR